MTPPATHPDSFVFRNKITGEKICNTLDPHFRPPAGVYKVLSKSKPGEYTYISSITGRRATSTSANYPAEVISRISNIASVGEAASNLDDDGVEMPALKDCDGLTGGDVRDSRESVALSESTRASATDGHRAEIPEHEGERASDAHTASRPRRGVHLDPIDRCGNDGNGPIFYRTGGSGTGPSRHSEAQYLVEALDSNRSFDIRRTPAEEGQGTLPASHEVTILFDGR